MHHDSGLYWEDQQRIRSLLKEGAQGPRRLSPLHQNRKEKPRRVANGDDKTHHLTKVVRVREDQNPEHLSRLSVRVDQRGVWQGSEVFHTTVRKGRDKNRGAAKGEKSWRYHVWLCREGEQPTRQSQTPHNRRRHENKQEKWRLQCRQTRNEKQNRTIKSKQSLQNQRGDRSCAK